MNRHDLDRIRALDGFWYMASPYTAYPAGREKAYQEAIRAAAWLVNQGVDVFSPIVHSHPLSRNGVIRTHEEWMALDRPFMQAATGLIVCKSPNWHVSAGVTAEIEFFQDAEKPVVYLAWPQSPPEDDE